MTGWYDIATLEKINSQEDEEGLADSRAYVEGLVRGEEAACGRAAAEAVVVGGFSQGGAVALSMLRSEIKVGCPCMCWGEGGGRGGVCMRVCGGSGISACVGGGQGRWGCLCACDPLHQHSMTFLRPPASCVRVFVPSAAVRSGGSQHLCSAEWSNPPRVSRQCSNPSAHVPWGLGPGGRMGGP
jgi:hypothetical protein